jgi:tetratricopeptide (TPR) repeat protein
MTKPIHLGCCLALLLLAGFNFRARAETSVASFDAANKLYEQANYDAAAAAYEKLLASGQVSAPLYFNLGNACFKAGRIGRAVAAYRQAELLAPRDPDVRANLQFARNQVQGPTIPPSRLQTWLGRLTADEWTWLAVAAVWPLLLLLAFLQWRPGLKRSLRSTVFLLAATSLALAACLGTVLLQKRYTRSAIVNARDVLVRQGTLDISPSVFTAHDGAELRVLDQKDEWLEVCSDSRHVGWLRRDEVILVPQT